jgi:GNAT superfamily N-acetyltransferase
VARSISVDALRELSKHVQAIEQAFCSQWAHFGQGPGGRFHADDGVTWIEAPVSELPYNAVVRTCLTGDIDGRIDEIIDRFRQRDVKFMWLVHPTAQPADLAARLARRGLHLVEHGTGMSLDVKEPLPPAPSEDGPVVYRQVRDPDDMAAFEELIRQYWDLGGSSHDYVFGINRWAHDLGHGARWVAFKHGTPVGKAYMSYTVGADAHAVSDDTAAVFGVYVRPEARGDRVASTLMAHLIEQAAATGRRRVVLHSSEMALSLYLRIGFAARCPLPVYATTDLHSMQPS